jgi:hypothetical protein
MGTRRAPLHGCFKAINCQFENPPFPCCDNALEEGSIKSIIDDDDEEIEADEEIKDSSLLGSPVGEAFKFIVGDEDCTVVVDDDNDDEVVDTADAVAATAAAATYSSTSCTCAK